ncbi:MAG: hypothetical protein KDI56_11770, partial [Xanthomonadales bacterium]|nr:hypothetical protein [Xanthomonadales bacterium]
TSTDSAAIYFRCWVEDARPTVCLGLLSQEPCACARYVEQAFEVRLSTTDAPTVAIGDRVQLVQTVVDMTAGSNADAQLINWRSLQACEESRGD